MRVIIAGSRSITSYDTVLQALCDSGIGIDNIKEVVSGCAGGVDRAGEHLAHIMNIPIKQFPADWESYGKRAGFMRNTQMAEYADALVAVWDGMSKGTWHMIKTAEEKGLWVYVHTVTK